MQVVFRASVNLYPASTTLELLGSSSFSSTLDHCFLCISNKFPFIPFVCFVALIPFFFLVCFHRVCYASITGRCFNHKTLILAFLLQDSNNTSCMPFGIHPLDFCWCDLKKNLQPKTYGPCASYLIFHYTKLYQLNYIFFLFWVAWDYNVTSWHQSEVQSYVSPHDHTSSSLVSTLCPPEFSVSLAWICKLPCCFVVTGETDIYLFVRKMQFVRFVVIYVIMFINELLEKQSTGIRAHILPGVLYNVLRVLFRDERFHLHA